MGNVNIEVAQLTGGKVIASAGTLDQRAVEGTKITPGTYKQAQGTLIVDAEGFVKFVPDSGPALTAVRAVA